MAISLVQEPQILQPGYNPSYWAFSSTNKALTGFRYIVDIYNALTDALIVRQRINPNVTYGNCILDTSKIISNYLSNNLPTLIEPAIAAETQFTYYLKVGEEYGTAWEYYDYEFYSSAGLYNGYVKLTSNHAGYMQTHTFAVGDQIIISQDDPDLTPGTLLLEGLHTIVEVVDNYSVVIDVPFSYIGSTIPGTATGSVTYADGRKTIYPDLYTSADKIVFNGAVTYPNFLSWANTKYDINNTNDKLLTDVPNVFTVGSGSVLTLNMWMPNHTQPDNYRLLYFENNEGTKRVCNANISTENQQIITTGVGPGNFPTTTLIAGTGTIIQNDTIWYSVMVTNSSYTQLSEKFYFYIDYTCSSFTSHELVFLDRMGSLGSFTFKYNTDETAAITRSMNNNILGTFDTDWSAVSTDGITKVVDVSIKEKMRFNTAWLTDAEAVYFGQLLSSPVVFLKIGSSFYPVTVDDTSYEVKTRKTNKNIKYSITVTLANNTQINW